MPAPLFSPNWYRVAGLRPRVRGHARMLRHVYRGRPWYVLEDTVNLRVHRFTPSTHAVIGLMNGERSVQEIWEQATETLGDDAPTQDEMIRLLGQLHAADILQSDAPPDTAELLARYEKNEQQQRTRKLLSPLALSVPLIDPDRFLRACLPVVRLFMSPFGAILWLAVVLPALFGVGMRWSELTEGILDHVLTPQNLLLIWLIFPVIKVLHEFGHGFIARHYGAEVHDMGVMLLVLTPVPYVDASAASAFPEKGRRALVAAGGMIVEVFVAALAFYVWAWAEPGPLRTVAYNTMVIGGFTTLTFNANPLLRFDGYYVLADLIEVPNLRQRANQYVAYLVERWGFGNEALEPPDTTGSEPGWLVSYAVSAFVYRLFVVGVIVLFVFQISMLLGFLLVGISLFGWALMPLVKGVRFLFTNPRIRRRRGRALGVVGGFVAGLLLLLFALPLPFRTQVEGVVWVPDEAIVRSQTPGFVERLLVAPGTSVREGDPLVRCSDPELRATQAVLEARLRGLKARYRTTRLQSVARARMLDDEIRLVRRRLDRARERLDALVLRAGRDGVFVVPQAADLPGRFVEKGQLLAYVVELDGLRVRAVVPQEDVALVRDRLDGVAVRRADRLGQVLEAELLRLVPAASDELPSVALGRQGGGSVAVDPRDQQGTASVQPIFQVELALDNPSRSLTVGGRVYVRFDHGDASLAFRGYRALRQVFLGTLGV